MSHSTFTVIPNLFDEEVELIEYQSFGQDSTTQLAAYGSYYTLYSSGGYFILEMSFFTETCYTDSFAFIKLRG